MFPKFFHLDYKNKSWWLSNVQSKYPPISDLSFATLKMWWDLDNSLEVSTLNENVVIHYIDAGDSKKSGYCIVGTNKIEDSIMAIFDYQKSLGLEQKLIHEPEFVKDLLVKTADMNNGGIKIENERDYDEYVLSAEDLSDLSKPEHSRTRRKVRRFIREVQDLGNIDVQHIDLDDGKEKNKVLKIISGFDNGGTSANDPNGSELEVINRCVKYAAELGIKCLLVYLGNEAIALSLYQFSIDKSYLIVNHIKCTSHYPNVFDFVTQRLAQEALAEGATYLNFEMDLGIEGLRFHKLNLRPVKFFKKYTFSLSGVDKRNTLVHSI